MDTKLTLSLNKAVIKAAKSYAKSNQTSLSKLIESYLSSLTNKKDSYNEITPLVESLSGVIELDTSFDVRDDYSEFLADKYE